MVNYMKTSRHCPLAIKAIQGAGFKIDENALADPSFRGIHATKTAEPVNLYPHHFTPAFRDLFVGEAVFGFYCTSHMIGELRLFRQRKVNTDKSASVRNVFGHGKTQLDAVQMFVKNFTASPIRYNVS